MAETAKEYQKLPGRGGRFEGARFVAGRRKSSSLWLGNDHLLAVDSAGFTEEYKRFYYRDIQSIIIRKTIVGRVWNWILGGLFLIPMIVVVALASDILRKKGDSDEAVALGVFATFAFFFLILLVVNWLRGPTCATHLKTAVQLEELVSLNRIRTTEKAMALLRNRIQDTQGIFAPEEAQVQAESFLQNPQASLNNPAWRANADTTIRSYVGRSHQIAFALVLADGVLTFAQIFLNSVPLVVFATFLVLAASGMVVTALIRQHQTDLPGLLRKLTWACAVYFAVNMFVTYVMSVGLAAGNPDQIQDEWLLLKRVAELRPLDKPWFLGWLAVSASVAVGLSAIGLLALKNFKARQLSATEAPPVMSVDQTPPAAS